MITATALSAAESYFLFLRDSRKEPEFAARWWNGLIDAILSLERMPLRCARIPEQRHFEEELRHLIYKRHRLIFFVRGHSVTVVRVYHGAQRPLSKP